MLAGSLFLKESTDLHCRPHAFAYYYKQWNDFHMPFHHHNSTEIMYVISGCCRVDVLPNNQHKQSITLKKGEFIVIDANVPHRLIVEEAAPCRMLNVEFGFVAADPIFPSIRQLAEGDGAFAELIMNPFSHMVLRDPDELYHVLKSLVLELDSGGAHGGMMVQLLFGQLLIRIARLREEAVKSGMHQTDFYVKKAIGYLHQNYDRDIQVKTVAEAVNLHPGYLQRIFKSNTGRTITEYLTGLRMEKAKMLLMQTDIPVIEISDYVGVGSRQYFHMLFKKYASCTPMEYRKSMHAERRNYVDGS